MNVRPKVDQFITIATYPIKNHNIYPLTEKLLSWLMVRNLENTLRLMI
jgi:hypothetical protein